ncbi:TPA: nucleotide sugar dehydrogenase [Bacillus cereus]|nr:nucleotide sugar dehydrogenase [Bacillus cereus]HDR4742363.1 nucleotide sugar dehydrogenase [Bacillus cereus]HDR4747949.1 nucleotide sugar dehydrogenase [Bacillus cereus]HDR4753424.1 nucleotide sugar dehydrogenase [Bacillus cereus]HDR4770633.1 nucleotide sugar dehydrogenase [Bacillus cereus]
MSIPALDTSATILNSEYTKLLERVSTKQAITTVVGLGYVGLPNVLSKAKAGYKVIGFDVDTNKVDQINRGISYIGDVPTDELAPYVENGSIIATTNSEIAFSHADVITICVPTPIDEFKQPDLKYVESSMDFILGNIKPGTLIMLESTTYPGTTEEYIVQPLIEKGFEVGKDVFVAYSPERIDPSNGVFNVDNTPRIVGGHTDSCTHIAKQFLGHNTTVVSSTKVAEMAKVYENTFRYVNIALANELALISDKMSIDAWEVIDASSTKPFGFMPFYPSAGVGGHCIPVDPYYLSYKAKQFDYTTKLIDIAGELDSKMKEHTVNKMIKILNQSGQSIKDAKIAILGVTYKKDVDDMRESSIYKLLPVLEQYGADVTLFDPNVPKIETKSKTYEINNLEYEKLQDFDLVFILTDHSAFDFQLVASHSRVIFDTKNACKKQEVKGVYYKL